MAAGGQPAPLWASPQATGELQLQSAVYLFALPVAVEQKFFPFLKPVLTEAQTSLIGSALARSGSLEPAEIGLRLPCGSFWNLLTETTPAAPHYQNIACNPNTFCH